MKRRMMVKRKSCKYILHIRSERTMIQWLLDANHPETVIAKRTGHKDMKSLKSYNNLRGGQSKAQQTTIFGAFNEKNARFR